MIDVNLKLPGMDHRCRNTTDAYAVVRWPETIALLTRLGVDLTRPYQQIVVNLQFDGSSVAEVYLKQRGSDIDAIG